MYLCGRTSVGEPRQRVFFSILFLYGGGFEVGYGLFYASLYLVFHMPIDLAVDREIYVRRHGQNSDPKGIERRKA